MESKTPAGSPRMNQIVDANGKINQLIQSFFLVSTSEFSQQLQVQSLLRKCTFKGSPDHPGCAASEQNKNSLGSNTVIQQRK